jgi:hypothetical protein
MLDTLVQYKVTPKNPKITKSSVVKQIGLTFAVFLAFNWYFKLSNWTLPFYLLIAIMTQYGGQKISEGKHAKYLAIDYEKRLVIVNDLKIRFDKIKSVEINMGRIVEIRDYDDRRIEVITPEAKKFVKDLNKVLSEE